MKHSKVQCSNGYFNAVKYNTVQYWPLQCSIVQCSNSKTVRYSTVQCSNGHYSAGPNALAPLALRDERNERILNSSYQGTRYGLYK